MTDAREEDDEPYAQLFAGIANQRERIATFEPVVFHAHSIDSHDWATASHADSVRNDRQRLSTPDGVREFLDTLAASYSVICITDHMRSGYATQLARAALQRDDITVLPGMEINCLVAPAYNDAIHLLAIFPPETSEMAIERIFAGKELVDPEERAGTEAVRFEDLRELRRRIREEANGLFVLAHVENPRRGHRARFRTDRAKTLKIYGDDAQLVLDLPDEYGVYLAKLRPDAVEIKQAADQHHYARFTADGEDHQLACVGPADHHCFEDYARAESATLVKVSACEFDAIAEALRFHETRVRLQSEFIEHTAPRLTGVRLTSPSRRGLFSDTTIAFSENLSCLIGPRGSGKSTVIEALRYVLGRNPQLAERLEADGRNFASLAQDTQRANLRDTQIELVYEAAGNQTILSATFDFDEPIRTRAFNPQGDDLHIAPQAVSADFPVAIFSWSEMEVLGRESGPQRDLVDRLLADVGPIVGSRETLYERLAENRTEVLRLSRELVRAREAANGRLGRYRQYREAYDALNTEEAAGLFAGLDAARRRRELLDSAGSDVGTLDEIAETLAETGVAERVEATVVATSEETRYWWEAGPGADLDIEGLGRAVAKTAGELKAALDRRRTVFAAWQEAAAKELAEVEQELRAQTRLDAGQDLLRDQREIARTRFEQVDADRERYLLDVDRLDRALETRKGLLADLEAVQDQISATREAHLAPLNEQLAEVGGEQMRITVQREHQADREDIERYLEDGPVLTLERAGRYKTRRVASRLTKMARPTDLSMALVESDCGNLGNELAVGVGDALDEEEATKLIENCVWRTSDSDADVDILDAEALDPLLELAERRIDDRVRIMLNDKPVDELSPGQRSSAMLPLIALAETDPLIIDQPEDNLDNAMVGETLTRILADLKERRQIIVCTHNPNIVVGGDAEQVVVLDAPAAHAAEVVHTGSIDDSEIIDAVLTVMEGGRDAFIARRKRYRVD